MDDRYSPPAPAVPDAPLDQARAAFEWLTRGPAPVTVDGRRFPPMPPRPVPMDEVRDWLSDRRVAPSARDAVWAHLVRRARTQPGTATVAVVGCALPTLTTISRRLCRGLPTTPSGEAGHRHGAARPRTASPDGAPEGAEADVAAGVDQVVATAVDVRHDIEVAVLVGFLAELARVELSQPRVLARLRSAAHEAGTAARRNASGVPVPQPRLVVSASPSPRGRYPEPLLQRAVTAGAITPAEAALIGATRIDPINLGAAAVARGQSYWVVRAARVRAERRLAAFGRTPDPDSQNNRNPSSDSDPDPDRGLDVDTGLLQDGRGDRLQRATDEAGAGRGHGHG